MGFESSSDHISTHASYAMVLVEKPGREAIVEAFQARRCYAATDNILLVVQVRRAPDGRGVPAWPASRRWRSSAAGTAPIATAGHRPQQPLCLQHRAGPRDVDLKWTDTDPPAGSLNYYYVRIEQADSNLAWSSPMWIRKL